MRLQNNKQIGAKDYLLMSLNSKVQQLAAPQMKQTSKQLVKFVQRRPVTSQPWKRSKLRSLTPLSKQLDSWRGMHASMLKLKNASSVAQALFALVRASTISSADANRQTALIQVTKSAESDGEDSLGAPAASVYGGHGGGIVDTLNDLLDRAEAQLDDARKTETADLHNYQMLKQSLVDEVKYANKEMAEAKAAIAESGEKKAIAKGNLDVTTKELNSDVTTLEGLRKACLEKAQDYEAAVKAARRNSTH